MISTPTVARDSAGPKATRNELASGAHTAVQQDDRQREVTHHIGERVIIEGDTADSVDSRQHADSRKMTRIGMPRRDENELNKMLKVTGMEPRMKRLIIAVAPNVVLLPPQCERCY